MKIIQQNNSINLNKTWGKKRSAALSPCLHFDKDAGLVASASYLVILLLLLLKSKKMWRCIVCALQDLSRSVKGRERAYIISFIFGLLVP